MTDFNDEVIAFVQNQIDGIQEQIDALHQEKTAQPLNEGYWEAIDIEKIINEYEVQQASWVANRAGLERHKEANGFCWSCHGIHDTGELFPCPSYTDIAAPIRSVM